jgi:hypothetical protein
MLPHLQGIPDITSQETIVNVITVRTSNYGAKVMAFTHRKPLCVCVCVWLTSFLIQNYWGFWTFPSSDILETRKHDVSEFGSVSVLR